MVAKENFFYDVEKCENTVKYTEKIEKNFADKVAFVNGNIENEISYRRFCGDIRRCASYFMQFNRKYFCITISRAYDFAVSFFAILNSDNIAVLSDIPISTTPKGKIAIPVIDSAFIKKLIATEMPCETFADIDPDTVAVVAQSSGTTSISKGVMLSQKALLSDMWAGMCCSKFSGNARYLHVIPYSHLFGLVANMLGPLYAGGTICDSGSSINIFEDFKKYRITNISLPPVLVSSTYKLIKTRGNSAVTGGYLKKVICAGAQPDYSVYQEFAANGIKVYTGYGLTECAPCVSMEGEFSSKIGSCGLPLICNRVRVIDGEIAVRGDNLMLGYWEDDDATAKVFDDGWLLTGDLGYFDEEGFLFLTGRKNSLIVFEDGTKLLPEYLENILCHIESVKECLVEGTILDNRTLLRINVVSDMNDIDLLKRQIKNVLISEKYINRLYDIIISDVPLERTKLGKIRRTG